MKDITKEIIKILDKLGINIACKGYKYWVSAAVIKIWRFPDRDLKEICKEIAEYHKVTLNSVEKAMYDSLNSPGKNLELQQYFHLNYKITNSVFLECLIREYRNSK